MSASRFSALHRRLFVVAGAAFALSLSAVSSAAPASGEPVFFGVSGPLTGPNAQYGAQWKAGFDLALDEINRDGGIDGHPLQYVFEDSQSDPRQAVAIAQKFVDDKRIVIELGDFSSPASMAASPIYQRAGLVQLGFTNSHPDFTKGGDFIWSPSVSQADAQPLLADLTVKQGFRRVAVLFQNTDWGRASKDVFVKAAAARGAQVIAAEGYQPNDKDFRATLLRVRDTKPDALVLISYYSDGAQIVRQARTSGITLPIVAASSVYSPKFMELGGDAVNGVTTNTSFFPGDRSPEVQRFVRDFQAKYHHEPDAFNAFAYDATIIAAYALRTGGLDRRGVRDALAKLHDVPSVVFGKATFDPATRRVIGVKSVNLVVENGQWALLGSKPALAAR
ncbi:ABC transporter substrate-binding protein [Paraburkholderia sp. CNPSo 3155]|uniref:Branched-chain amino acid transport system substrate-binding protein n=1 Tax=Paraburkholderia atlantica TaxID=2654982 RepID=A0A6I1PUS7_PARAM|nr:ABC transporter substrate-binding protein [Paraburkholderia atlantica]MBB5415055.1 branched-chain amino acid transport system substrate-binding protein [Paraburkholderia atlantica]MBB5423854.1 branched-chain amino acid transport system substrate-binding protein [Paraburkholderia atlantica]MPW08907.1 ABC transporter substrate-binding protein [Paraburkholderia atlantica]